MAERTLDEKEKKRVRDFILHLDNKEERANSGRFLFKFCEDREMRFVDAVIQAFSVDDASELQERNDRLSARVDQLEEQLKKTGKAMGDALDGKEEVSMREWVQKLWRFKQFRMILIGLVVSARMAYPYVGPAKYSIYATALCCALCLFLLLQWSMAVSSAGFGLLFVEFASFTASMVGSVMAFLSDPMWGFVAVAGTVALLSSKLWEKLANSDNGLLKVIRGCF